jgi:hypothetical protein
MSLLIAELKQRKLVPHQGGGALKSTLFAKIRW